MELHEHYQAWHKLVYDWPSAPRFNGITCQQHQSDLDRYAEVICELKPAWVLQTGVYWGGTAAFLANVMSCANPDGRVLTVDTDLGPCQARADWNLEIRQGNAVGEDFHEYFLDWADGERGLVSLDDDHGREQVARELELYAPHASYLVVEDTVLNLAVGTHYQPSNPAQALEEWLPRHPEFQADPDPEPTQHIGGWLRRIAG